MSAGDLHSVAEVSELPVLFRPPLVEKILAGAKTQTRRPVKGARGAFWDHAGYRPGVGPDGRVVWDPPGICQPNPRGPLGQVGTRLWVRETWQALVQNSNYHEMNRFSDGTPEYDERWEAVETKDLERARKEDKSFSLVYRAGADEETLNEIEALGGWRPSLHMRRWMCRLVLEVTEVRIERLQRLTPSDLRAEGYDEMDLFRRSWDRTYAQKGVGWADDPWIWVAGFKVVEWKGDA